jgi:hypothetical protein
LVRFNRPWVHFIALGLLLFYLQLTLFPAPKPVVGPLGEGRLQALQQAWVTSTGQLPTAEQQARLTAAELDKDMLFQRAIGLDLHLQDVVVYQTLLRAMSFLRLAEGKTEAEIYTSALDMRLHLSDVVVKRRLISVMEKMLLTADPPQPIGEQELLTEFEARREELRRPPRFSIEHLYFKPEDSAKVEAAVAAIAAGDLMPVETRGMGSSFLPGYRFSRQTPPQLARHFGADFAANLQAADPQPARWHGPLRSAYGLHYVWVSAIEPARDATLDEVRRQLRRDLEYRAKAAALQAGIAALRKAYEVRL